MRAPVETENRTLVVPAADAIERLNRRFIQLASAAQFTTATSIYLPESWTTPSANIPRSRLIFTMIHDEPTTECALHWQKLELAIDLIAYTRTLYEQSAFGVSWALMIPPDLTERIQSDEPVFRIAESVELYATCKWNGSRDCVETLIHQRP